MRGNSGKTLTAAERLARVNEKVATLLVVAEKLVVEITEIEALLAKESYASALGRWVAKYGMEDEL